MTLQVPECNINCIKIHFKAFWELIRPKFSVKNQVTPPSTKTVKNQAPSTKTVKNPAHLSLEMLQPSVVIIEWSPTRGG